MSRQIRLALRAYGVGGPGQHNLWKDPRVPKNASIDIDWYIAQAKAAEHALFDAFFIVDSQFIDATYPPHYLNRLEPLTLLSAVATHTRHIGLVGTLSSTYNSPLQVVRGLWDSYEDDAFPASGDVFLDPSKLHALNHTGEHFRVDGPLNLSRSPQGQPVIFQAGVSEEGRNLAAHVAEGIYAPGGSLDAGREYYADIKRRAAALGRNPDHVVIFLGAQPVVAGTDEEALRLSREIFESDNDFDRKLAQFGRAFGAHDFSRYDLDAPFPDVAHLAEKSGRTRGTEIIRRVTAEGLTLRETVLAFTRYQPSPFTGAPDTVAATIAAWFEAGAFDGLNVGFRTGDDLSRFVADVVPLLQKQGLFRTSYEHDTLRGHLGLPIPANRWSAAS